MRTVENASLEKNTCTIIVNNRTCTFVEGGKKKPIHCKKRLAVFPSPAEMSLTKLLL